MSDVDPQGLHQPIEAPVSGDVEAAVASAAEPPAPELPEPELASAPEKSADEPPEVVTPPEPEPQPVRQARPPTRPPRREDRPGLLPAMAVPLDQIEPDAQFQLREVGELAGLATSIARMGQLFPIDVRPRGGALQVVAGFRRLAAVRFLQRSTVLARVHEEMTDSQAWAYALAQTLESKGVTPEEIRAVRERLEQHGQLTPMARGLIDAALTAPGSDLEPEEPQSAQAAEEVDLDELAADLHERLSEISGDLSLITDLWLQLDAPARAALLDQLRYYGELFQYLSRLR